MVGISFYFPIMGKCMIAIDTVEENFNDKDVRRTTQ
jgi:hypothetical protein